MKRNVIRRLTALFLAAAVCTGLYTGLTVSAEEMNEGAGERTEQTEVGQAEESLSGEEAGEPGTLQTEEQEEGLETAENPETDKETLLSEEEGAQEGQRALENQEKQSEEQEQTEKQERKMSNWASAAGLSDPRIETDSSMEAGQKVTWDCVWFGSYPQAEVVSSSEEYTSLDESLIQNGNVIADSDLYQALEKASGWDSNNDVTVDGNRYRRMKKGDATFATSGEDRYYDWPDSDTYHYFKYEPIKWRVLNIDGKQALLLSDVVLDDQKYNTITRTVTWETSTIRSWLNGYSASANEQGVDYSGKNFIGSAFTSDEQSAIENTSLVNADKVYLLSKSEVYEDNAVSFGFVSDWRTDDEARRCKSSTYAKAMGACCYCTTSGVYKGNCTWLLRSRGTNSNGVADILDGGLVNIYGSNISSHNGVRAVLNLNLSSDQWSCAGTVCSDGMVEEVDAKQDTGSSTVNPDKVTNTDIKVSKITLSGISKKIAAGKKIRLIVKVIPSNAKNKAVTWKSSNTKVATVNSKGVVTLKKNSGGKKVTITATAKDGSKKKATYNITSMKGVVKKITISGKKTRTLKVGKTLKLKAKVTASNSKQANKKLKWTSSNTKYATVSSTGKVKTKKAGKRKTVTITTMATDGSNKKASVKVKIK